MNAKMTVRGMYNFDNTLFDYLTFPVGIDRDLAISRILNKTEEFCVVYSDFDYFKDRIGTWGKVWERTFEKWVAALAVEYDPLFNYDRHEVIDDTAASHSSTTTSATTTSNTENKVSAYDSDAYSNKEKVDSGANTSQGGVGDADSETHRRAHLYGNIGVTTSQQMLRDELDIAQWNLYEHISDLFLEEFCILIY